MAVEAVVSVVVQKLVDLLIEEAKFLSGVKEQVVWIKEELRGMQCFLKDADKKQAGGDERVKNWIAEIRDVAYDAEDIIDNFILRKERRKNEKTVKRYTSSIFGELKARHKVGDEIKGIMTRLSEISERRSKFGIENLGATTEASCYATGRLREKRRSSPRSDQSDVFGLEEDLMTLKSRLLENELNRRVISIVGMGGLGKTTLARKVYNCNDFTGHFQCRIWIYVSQAYTTKGLLEDIWKEVKRSKVDDLTINQIEEDLSENLKGKRYLLVMDDVWDVNAWNSVKGVFPDTKNGSRVLLTTRKRDVALQADPKSPPHEPKLLNDEISWELFLKKVGIEESECPQNLKKVGKEIVGKCEGLPLAIVVLGGILAGREVTFSAWSRLLERVSWQLKQDQTNCSEILALSYDDLPHYLKPCFIYFGVFPEDHEIRTRRLIGYWLAEGLLQHRDNESLEDVGDDYIEELIDRSMIQVVERRPNDTIKTCRMHDLIRDLALSKAKEANFLHVYQNTRSTLTDEIKIRRLAVHNTVNNCPSSIDNLRSYFVFESGKEEDTDTIESGEEEDTEEDTDTIESGKEEDTDTIGEAVSKFLNNGIQNKGFGLLRVLDLEEVTEAKLPEALGQLIHLRYLGLRRVRSSSTLPSSLSNLRNLQTLDLKNTAIDVSEFPIWKLQQLRHLYMNVNDQGCNIRHPPASSSKSSSLSFQNLRTLSGLYVDEETWVKGGLDKSVHLKKLIVSGNLASQGESLSNWFVKLDRLEVLKLVASTDPLNLPTMMRFSNNKHLYKLDMLGRFPEKLLDVHEFPPNLTTLTLQRCELEADPFPTLEKLQNLRNLRLAWYSYIGKDMACSSGGFQRLQVLEIWGLSKLETWKVEDGALPSLKMLKISSCSELKMIPDGLQHNTTLQELVVKYMPQKFTTRLQRTDGMDWYKIQHIPSIVIDN